MPAYHRRPPRNHRSPLEPGRAQAMLWMRAIAASSDLPAYWNWHIAREHHRNHLSKLQNPPTPQHALGLAA